ncbi:hypothetical protein GO988_08280 [Hymenobacter sp. HMF4947]|uniref:Carboxypeptidase-like regulatory domain-containing protein n=1 Tax=Hymenobacter ginkgonis TaxID=2682976 RepID=A0A7K1TD53_9BACT|nr:carboxypeptidase-like regulatory domain-containing protein [Hymenobacter ginkgonis]MVN76320.1 hypothetical protein [Hymenobacter ginkgonis]
MKNSVLFFSLFLASAGPVLAQTAPTPHPAAGAPAQPCAVFSGRVSASEKPLAGVTVAVKGTSIILITNEEGFFTLPAQVTQFPTLAVSAAGYAPIELTLNSCTPVMVEMQLLPGTRIKQRGKRKGFIMKTGQ